MIFLRCGLFLGFLFLQSHFLFSSGFITSYSSKQRNSLSDSTFRFNRMKKIYRQRNYKAVLQECRKMIALYPRSRCAMECLDFYAKSLLKLKRYYPAYLKFQDLLAHYPSFDRRNEIIVHQVEIGNYFFYKALPRLFSSTYQYEYALEIFQSIVQVNPYGEYSEYAQFHLAESYRFLKEYGDSLDAYNLLIERFPQGVYVRESRFKIAMVQALISQNSLYASDTFEKEILSIEYDMKKNRNMPRIKILQKEIEEMKDQIAKKILGIASYYERQKKLESARLYYKDFYRRYFYRKEGAFVKKKILKLKKIIAERKKDSQK